MTERPQDLACKPAAEASFLFQIPQRNDTSTDKNVWCARRVGSSHFDCGFRNVFLPALETESAKGMSSHVTISSPNA